MNLKELETSAPIRNRWIQRGIWTAAFGLSCVIMGSNLDKEIISPLALMIDVLFVSFFGYQLYLEFDITIVNVTTRVQVVVDPKGNIISQKQMDENETDEKIDEGTISN